MGNLRWKELVLVLLLLFALSGCGGTQAGTAAEGETQIENAEETSDNETASADGASARDSHAGTRGGNRSGKPDL